MNYNKSQQQAIRHKDGPMLVLAGPGSGKTAVITQRTKQLIEYENIDPSNILVITFTRAAAQEMKQRFLAATGEERTKVTFGTFHAIFFMVLKLAYHFDSGNIISEEQRYQFMREILSYHHLEYRDEGEFIGDVLTEISRVKNEQIPLEHFYSSSCGEEVFRKIYREYDERLKRNRLIDFDDMLTYTYDLFSQRKDILSAWQKKYRYILIDEFQDINLIQWKIMCMLAAPENNLFVVGDDDQSIYRFRGAKPEIMLNFQKDFPTAGRVLLNDNFRSTRQIVNAAGRVIRKNQSRFAKEITARGGEGPGVRILAFEDQQQECLYLLKEMQEYKKNGGAWQQMAVLYRTNTQPRLLIQKFMEFNVPFRVRDQVPNLFEHWIAKNLFCYIRLACGSKLRKDLLPVLNRPKRYMNRECLNDEIICWEYMMDYYKDKLYVCDKIERLQYDLKMLGRMGPFAAINYIRHVMGYEEYLKEYAEFRRMNAEDLMEVLNELQESARAYKTYDEWFAYMERYKKEMDEMRKRQQEVKEGVHLATMHSSKGLEYDKVFILDAAEGITPYKKAVLDADLEEERRMFYVAMTRAKKELTICWAKKQFSHELTVSRFVEEMKDDRAV